MPLRSHGSVSMNRTLMAAGLVDRLQLTIFPVITGQKGAHPLFQDAADFDLELVESRTFDGGIQEPIYQPTLHRLHGSSPQFGEQRKQRWPSRGVDSRSSTVWTRAHEKPWAMMTTSRPSTRPSQNLPCPRPATAVRR